MDNTYSGVMLIVLVLICVMLVHAIYEGLSPPRLSFSDDYICIQYKGIRSCFDEDEDILNKIKDLQKK